MDAEDQSTSTAGQGIATGAQGRATGFPDLRLSKAAEYIKSAAQQGQRHSPRTMADYMGHGSASSGPFRTKMAALRDYGLVTGGGDQLTITDDGMLLANADDAAQEQAVLRRAFLHCQVFRQVYESTGKGQPVSLLSIGNRAVLDFGVRGSSKERFAKAFVENAVDAGLADMQGDQVVVRAAAAGQSRGNTGPARRQQQQPPLHDGARDYEEVPPAPDGSQPIVLNQTWPFHEGSAQLILQSFRPLPPSAYAEIAKVVEAAAGLIALLDVGKPAEPQPRRDVDAADEELA